MTPQHARWIILCLDLQQAGVPVGEESVLPMRLVIHHFVEVSAACRCLLRQSLLESFYICLGLTFNVLVAIVLCCANDVPVSVAELICHRSG